MIMKVKKRDLINSIIAIGIFLMCFSNYYISHIVPYWSVLQYYGKIFLSFALIILLIPFMFRGTFKKVGRYIKKDMISTTFRYSMILILWIATVTLLKRGELKDCLDSYLGLVIISVYLELKSRNKYDIFIIFKTWVLIIFLLTLIDIFTELKFPSGLYRTNIKIYTQYWFLGYKTERLRYILPMIMMSIFSSFFSKKVFLTFIVCICGTISTILSGATAASIILLLITLIYLSMMVMSQKGRKEYPKIVGFLFNYKVLAVIYIIISILIVYSQNTNIAELVSMYLQKGANFSSRGKIWTKCLELIANSPFTGVGYYTVEQYQAITGMIGGTNAHNMILSILMSGGLIGGLIYGHMVFGIFKSPKGNRDYNRYFLVLMNYLIFVLGITSSIMVFSTFGMLGFWMLEYYDRVH